MNTIDERGPCLACGAADSAWFIGRGNGPLCNDHARAASAGFEIVDRKTRAQFRRGVEDQGRAYWRARGIEIGTQLECLTMGMFGASRFTGIAKVGGSAKGGAYVSGRAHGKAIRFDPDAFTRIKATT